MEREQRDSIDDGPSEELEGPDSAGHTTAITGAAGEPARDDDHVRPVSDRGPLAGLNADADETAAGSSGGGGAGPGFVAPPPGADWPDPLGGDDEERELERRTR